MSSSSLEDTDLNRTPNLDLAQLKFLLSLPEYADDEEPKNLLMEAMITYSMAPWYEMVCEELKWERNDELLRNMKEHNEEVLREMDEGIEDCKSQEGTSEVKTAILKKAEFLSTIGDKEGAIRCLGQAYNKTIALGYHLDNVFHCIRIGLFFMDRKLIELNFDRAQYLVDMGSDYERKNKLKIYRGLYAITTRDFAKTAEYFLASTSTFTCTELLSYSDFMKYTIYTAMLTFPRHQLQEKIIKGDEIYEILHDNPEVNDYLLSFYECRYSDFFTNLAKVETMLRKDLFFHLHYQYYVREMRILTYNQLLSSYKSVTLAHMAEQFGVTEEFVEADINKFIIAGRIKCMIDKEQGTLVTTRLTSRSEEFRNVIRHGDILLNRVQKLSRTINI